MADDAAIGDEDGSTAGEGGGHFTRGPRRANTPIQESGLTALKEQRMLHRAAKQGWLKEGRWPTEATPTDLKNKQQERGELTAKEMAVAVSTTNMSRAFERIEIPNDPIATREIALANGSLAQKAAGTIVLMERQNQTDDLMALKLQADGENARALSGTVLESILGQCVEAVRETVGPDQAREVHALLAERLTVEGQQRRGTDRTPDQDVMDMDATISGPP